MKVHFNVLVILHLYALAMLVNKAQGCPFHKGKAKVSKSEAPRCPFSTGDSFGPSMPIVEGQLQVPSWGTIGKRLVLPGKPYELPALKRADVGLSPQGPNGVYVEAGNQWPNEKIHPQFPEFGKLSGRAKAESISHYSHLSRRTGQLDPLGEHGLTKNPQIIPDPVGMRWPFEPTAQVAASYPREKNMHGRGSWGEIEIVPNPDPTKRLPYGIFKSGGVGDFRMSLGADQSTNVVGGALGIPLSPNEQGVESANLLMLSSAGPQLDDLDYFARPLSTVALPTEETPTQFVVLDHLFKASAESGVRPGNHMFHYNQDGEFDSKAPIPAEVQLAPNPDLTLHKLAGLQTQAVDGVDGQAVRQKYGNLRAAEGQPQFEVLDLALSEALVKPDSGLAKGSNLALEILDAEGIPQTLSAKVGEQTDEGVKLEFLKPSDEARMAIYQSTDLIWELGRRIKPGQDLYQVNLKMEDGSWNRDVARVKAKSEFFPSGFADHQRMYAHTERPNKTPILRKMLEGVRHLTGNIAEAIAAFAGKQDVEH